jgi:antitoxin component YwqK of YwqJK toxin-antitoxin module
MSWRKIILGKPSRLHLDDHYQLTPEQISDSWLKIETQYVLRYIKNGVYNSPHPGIPSRQEWHKNGRLLSECYHQNGELHDPSPGVPALREWYKNGQLRYEQYYQSGQWHDPSIEVPARREWHKNGQLMHEQHCQSGQWHDPSPGVPACRDWYKNGQLARQGYYQNGRWHDPSPGAPALRDWYKNGRLAREQYCQSGRWHDPDPYTPAYRMWNENGKLSEECYCRSVIVPQGFWSWTIHDALASKNTEQRRIWFEENGGWEQLENKFTLVDEQPDPGNPGHTLRLCDFPPELDPYEGQARIVFCDNASLDLDGSRRRYGLVFPREWGDNALTVMARSFGLSREQYAGISVAR